MNRTVTHTVVMDLVEGLDSKGHNIYINNYYSSPSLFSDLYKHGFGACGTVGINCTGMPKEWQKKKKVKKAKMMYLGYHHRIKGK